ncbi:MAG: hypothetical protein U9P81_02025 [Euryarchaeota archaeon]|nr:hypothetical protein [Euryarchaeota archaeon]
MMKILTHRILMAVICLSTLFLGCIEEENHKIELPIDTPEEAIEYAKTDNNTKEVCFVNKLFALEPFEFMEPKFIYYFYQTTDFQKQFISKMTGLIGGFPWENLKKSILQKAFDGELK